jgi:hypothetical protein
MYAILQILYTPSVMLEGTTWWGSGEMQLTTKAMYQEGLLYTVGFLQNSNSTPALVAFKLYTRAYGSLRCQLLILIRLELFTAQLRPDDNPSVVELRRAVVYSQTSVALNLS